MPSVKQSSSRAPSGPPSIRSQTQTPTQTPTPKASSTPPPKGASTPQLAHAHSSTLKSKLKNMFEAPRSASFAVNVTIHELGNVPQLEGQFAVKWKFRGRKPHDADRLLDHPVQRAHVIESKVINKTAPPLRHSSSAMSLHTTSTTSTTNSTTSSPPPWKVGRVVSTSSHQAPHHSSSLPAISVKNGHDSKPRKGTDPTPLRQVSGTAGDSDSRRSIVEEPAESSHHLTTSPETSATILPSVASEPNMKATSSPKNYPSSLADTDTQSFVSTSDLSRPRVSSRASTRSDRSINPAVVVTRHRPPTLPSIDMDNDSTERKGRTPTCSVRAHAVAWDYKVQHVIRVPLGKTVEVEEPGASRMHHHLNTGPAPKQHLPILGAGPMGDSGLKLDIEQIEQHGETAKSTSGKDVLFGYVNIDLAPFADHGPITRKFLLKSSKTNATIRVTIDMRFIGGEQDWASPPMEGHLPQSLSELTGDDAYPDLALIPSRSGSSNSDRSYHSSVIRPSGRSTPSLNKLPSSVNAAVHASKRRYRTYEHHLLPEIANRKQTLAAQRRASSLLTALASPAPTAPLSASPTHPPLQSWHSYSGSVTSSNDANSLSPRLFPNESAFTTSPQILPKSMSLTASPVSTPGLAPVPLSPTKMELHYALPNGPHSNGHHSNGHSPSGPSPPISPSLSPVISRSSILTRLSPITTRLDTPSDGSASLLSGQVTPMSVGKTHHHHTHYLRDREDEGNDLQPDVVIESLFNPTVGEEFTPFTYVAENDEEGEVEDEEEEDDFEGDVDGEEHLGRCKLRRARRIGVTLPLHGHNPTAWNKIRKRVLSHPHKLG